MPAGPTTSTLLIQATHRAKLGRAPRLFAGGAAFYSAKNETAASVKRVRVPNCSTKSAERKREQNIGTLKAARLRN